ncbi:peptidylprolyl isomerase [Parahaliea mediterranea]|uniref:peptidylprolyl isomerase n=1 Tax=Parahaliea mediterranea TaxID=651086 RepID=A0A939DE39_9GAMM|nr:peptidylprolyl isomerase [Parahaliea mediterranea]MBN7796553.1 peptidylprolyl isomerase [Parahaliea mediterranea]
MTSSSRQLSRSIAMEEGEDVSVIIKTTLGNVEVMLYPWRAPKSVSCFLAHVDGKYYQNASFYRSTGGGEDVYSIVQGGIFPRLLAGVPVEQWADIAPPLSPVEHETTFETGLDNECGVVALARLQPGTAGSEFFINMADNKVLNTGADCSGRDGYGYATFGRVVRGLDVLRAIQRLERQGMPAIGALDGQVLSAPVQILSIDRM